MNKTAGKKVSLRIVIYGAGAVGGVVGGLLALSDTPVVLIGRPNNVNAIREHGLLIVTPGVTQTIKLPVVTMPDQVDFGPTDVVFLSVKGQDTERAMRDLHAVVKDVPIFCFQNGVRNEEIVSKYYPRVHGVMVRAGSVFKQDGEVTSINDPPGRFVIGRYPMGKDKFDESIAAKLRNARYEVVVTAEIMPYKWGKLVVNLTNAIGAITNIGGEEYNRISKAVQDEGKMVLSWAGIRWIPVQEPPLLNTKGSGRLGYDPSGMPMDSTWQSLTRRQGTVETEFLNGEIVRIAQRFCKRAPINETLLRITEEMAAHHEPPGKYTPAELIRLLKLH
jgi:2-dehydropantoate 2-reductase